MVQDPTVREFGSRMTYVTLKSKSTLHAKPFCFIVVRPSNFPEPVNPELENLLRQAVAPFELMPSISIFRAPGYQQTCVLLPFTIAI
jgi:hypothetical protein